MVLESGKIRRDQFKMQFAPRRNEEARLSRLNNYGGE